MAKLERDKWIDAYWEDHHSLPAHPLARTDHYPQKTQPVAVSFLSTPHDAGPFFHRPLGFSHDLTRSPDYHITGSTQMPNYSRPLPSGKATSDWPLAATFAPGATILMTANGRRKTSTESFVGHLEAFLADTEGA
ncbi:hypothetical protein RQP46_005645 [Phenoliferia psychrophenolica]